MCCMQGALLNIDGFHNRSVVIGLHYNKQKTKRTLNILSP